MSFHDLALSAWWSSPEDDLPARPLRILLAEDAPAGQKVVAQILDRRGHAVVIVGDGRKSVDQLTGGDFDLVLMDVQMPVMDGFQATAAIRALPGEKARVPIIALTASGANGNERHCRQCLQAGMDAYLPKPVHPQRLIDLVERLGTQRPAPKANGAAVLPGRSPTRAEAAAAPGNHSTQTGAAPADMPVATEEIFCLKEALRCCFGQQAMFVEMAGYFVNETPGLLKKMQTALSNGNGKPAAAAAHQLRGTLLYLGAGEALKAASALEAEAAAGDLAAADQSLHRLEEQTERLKQILRPYFEHN